MALKEKILPSGYDNFLLSKISYKKFDISLFLLSLPLLGLWVYALFPRLRRREICRELFALHLILLTYVLASECFLSLSLWIVPYYTETVVLKMITVNTVVSVFLFGRITMCSLGIPCDVFSRYLYLRLIRDWVIPPLPPTESTIYKG